MGALCCRYAREDHLYSYQSRCCCCRVCCLSPCLGCCCELFTRRRESDNARASVQCVAASASAGLLALSPFEASTPDTYQAPPMPLPYERPASGCDKSGPIQHRGSHSQLESAQQGMEALTESDSPKKTDLKTTDEKLKSSDIVATEEEDVCPTCLEEYDEENPRIITKCGHHFHLACILEWMERSDSCPMCYQEVIIDETY